MAFQCVRDEALPHQVVGNLESGVRIVGIRLGAGLVHPYDERGVALGIRSFADSLDSLESEPATREFFGDEFITAYTTMRRYELSRIADWVSDWERTEYLELF